MWRWDFAWPELKLALELDGRGRHQTVDGTRKDCEKRNTGVCMGWRVLVYPSLDKQDAALWVETVHAAIRTLQGRPYVVVESKPPQRRVKKQRRELTLAEQRARTRAEQAEAKAERRASKLAGRPAS